MAQENFADEVQKNLFPEAKDDWNHALELTNAKSRLEVAVLASVLPHVNQKTRKLPKISLLKVREEVKDVLGRDLKAVKVGNAKTSDLTRIRQVVTRFKKQLVSGKKKLFLNKDTPVYRKNGTVKRYIYGIKSNSATERWRGDEALREAFKPYTEQNMCARRMNVPHLPKGYALDEKTGDPVGPSVDYCKVVKELYKPQIVVQAAKAVAKKKAKKDPVVVAAPIEKPMTRAAAAAATRSKSKKK
jgi:hypothetical protein